MTDAGTRLLEPGTDPDATRLFLARLLWRASSPLVASLLLGSCAAPESTPLEQRQEALTEPSLHCDGRGWRPMSALKLTQPADFVALRSSSSAPRPTFSQIDAAGMPCAKATDPRLCLAELARVSLLETSTGSHLAFTQGDTVRALQSLEDKLSLLGTIDTPDEALLIAQHHGFVVGCQSHGVAGAMTQVRVREDGYRIFSQVSAECGQLLRSMADVDADGAFRQVSAPHLVGMPCPPPPCCPGRRPANLQARRPRRQPGPGSRLARYFAHAANLEAASIPAFEQLASELRVFGAPSGLHAASQRAVEDEVRHAAVTSALAERHGARPEAPRLSRQRLRDRSEVALDNAIEGCVNETYAAYVATAQARLAYGTTLFPALQGIAADETRHAALAWRLAAWLEPQLAPDVRRRIDAARTRALLALGSRAG